MQLGGAGVGAEGLYGVDDQLFLVDLSADGGGQMSGDLLGGETAEELAAVSALCLKLDGLALQLFRDGLGGGNRLLLLEDLALLFACKIVLIVIHNMYPPYIQYTYYIIKKKECKLRIDENLHSFNFILIDFSI